LQGNGEIIFCVVAESSATLMFVERFRDKCLELLHPFSNYFESAKPNFGAPRRSGRLLIGWFSNRGTPNSYPKNQFKQRNDSNGDVSICALLCSSPSAVAVLFPKLLPAFWHQSLIPSICANDWQMPNLRSRILIDRDGIWLLQTNKKSVVSKVFLDLSYCVLLSVELSFKSAETCSAKDRTAYYASP
jgi:hypothetical protein